MKNTQNEKISQIKLSTLVVGIDLAKETHYARAFEYNIQRLAASGGIAISTELSDS